MERLNKEIIKALKTIIASTGTEITDWPQWSPAIQECLNKEMPVSNRDTRAPMELLTGLAPKTAVDQIEWIGVKAVTGVDVSDDQLRAPLAHMHDMLRGLWDKAVASQVKRAASTLAARVRRNRPSGVLPRINIGDIVLVAEAVKDNKLQIR